jgi:hypothetical protein
VAKKRTLPGLNIQWPISQEILSGLKTVETRTYSLPQKYENTELAIIETPGPQANFKARIVGIVIFENSFKYLSKKDFYADYPSHRVDQNSAWAWDSKKPKWGWRIKCVVKFSQTIPFEGKKGIVFSKNCSF